MWNDDLITLDANAKHPQGLYFQISETASIHNAKYEESSFTAQMAKVNYL